MNTITLWNKRFQEFSQQAVAYLTRIVANSGFVVVIIFLLILGAYYYRDLLDWLPSAFPVALLISLLFTLLVSTGKIRTFITEADIYYLTPMETKMEPYFLRSIVYSWVVQSFFLFLFSLLVNPLYVERIDNGIPFAFLVALLVVLKGANLYSRWIELRLHKQKRRLFFFLRFLANFLFIYGFLHISLLVFSIPGAVLLSMVIYSMLRHLRQQPYNWFDLVGQEKKLDSRFYRFINLFVDISFLQNGIRSRNWLPGITRLYSFDSHNAYRYLYVKMLLRGNQASMLLRLTVVSSFLIYVIPDFYGEWAGYILFLMIAGMQLRSFWTSFHNQFWFYLYPLSEENKVAAFVTTTFQIMLVLSVLAAIPHFFHQHEGLQYVYMPVSGIIFSYIYSRVMLKRFISQPAM